MKTLVLVRHAKSDWDVPDTHDIDRPLNSRGVSNSAFMAEIVAKKGPKADLIFSSPANRALTTAKTFAAHQNYNEHDIKIEEKIYYGIWKDIATLLIETDDKYDTVYVFGHNPTISILCNNLSSNSFDHYPTCGVACIDFKVDHWYELDSVPGRTRYFEFPKKHLL